MKQDLTKNLKEIAEILQNKDILEQISNSEKNISKGKIKKYFRTT